MSAKSENIAALIHRTRGTWTSDDISTLVEAIRAATPQEAQLALLQFSSGMLKAAACTVRVQLGAYKTADNEAGNPGLLN